MTTLPELAEWAAAQHAQGLSERTITERLSTVGNMIGHTGCDPTRFTHHDIVRFVGRAGLTPTTRATYHASIRAYARWLVFTGYRADNPCDKTLAPKRSKGKPRPVTDAQLAGILAAANRDRTRCYILLAALAGLRVHEIAKIRGDDFTDTTLTVTGKGSSTWTVPLHPTLNALRETHPTHTWWFPAYAAEPDECPHVGAHAVSKAIKDAMTRAGVVGTPHQLRHWFGTTLANRGVDLGVVQLLMRHESPATTTIYAQIRMDRQEAGLKMLGLPPAA